MYGPGMHRFVLDEAELGWRVAHAFDVEYNIGWTAWDDMIFDRYEVEQREGSTECPIEQL